jgi:hypothetical protein
LSTLVNCKKPGKITYSNFFGVERRAALFGDVCRRSAKPLTLGRLRGLAPPGEERGTRVKSTWSTEDEEDATRLEDEDDDDDDGRRELVNIRSTMDTAFGETKGGEVTAIEEYKGCSENSVGTGDVLRIVSSEHTSEGLGPAVAAPAVTPLRDEDAEEDTLLDAAFPLMPKIIK